MFFYFIMFSNLIHLQENESRLEVKHHYKKQVCVKSNLEALKYESKIIIDQILIVYSSNLPYASDLMESIPVRRILIEAEKCDNGLAYRNIYPELLGLVASNYPEIFDIENLLIEEDRLSK